MPGLNLSQSVRELEALVAAGCRPDGLQTRVLVAAAKRWADAVEVMQATTNQQHAYGCTIYYGGACACGMERLRELLREPG